MRRGIILSSAVALCLPLLATSATEFSDGDIAWSCAAPRNVEWKPDKTLESSLPTVTVVVPTFARKYKFHGLLNHTFFLQDYPEDKLELAVLDDEPDAEGTESPLAEFWRSHPRVSYSRAEPGSSLGTKRNQLIDDAKGEYIVHFDDDDFYNKHYVRFVVEYLMKRPSVKMLAFAGFYGLGPRVATGSKAIQPGSDGFESLSKTDVDFSLYCFNMPKSPWSWAWTYAKDVSKNCTYDNRNYAGEESVFAECVGQSFGVKAIQRIGDEASQAIKLQTCFGVTSTRKPDLRSNFDMPLWMVDHLYGKGTLDAISKFVLPFTDPSACEKPPETRSVFLTGTVTVGTVQHQLSVFDGQSAAQASEEFAAEHEMSYEQKMQVQELVTSWVAQENANRRASGRPTNDATDVESKSMYKDRFCGKRISKVLDKLQKLHTVTELGPGASELVASEVVDPWERPQIRVLSDSEYEKLALNKYKHDVFRKTSMERGVKNRILVKVRDGWLLPNGFAFNTTHKFELGVLNQMLCIETGTQRSQGATSCSDTDADEWVGYFHGPWNGPFDRSSKDKLVCKQVESVIAIGLETAWHDYSLFLTQALPMLLWVRNKLPAFPILWRFNVKKMKFLKPWLKLLGLLDRTFEHFESSVRFKELYMPHWVGASDDFTVDSDSRVFAPRFDVQQFSQATHSALGNVAAHREASVESFANKRFALLLVRTNIRRSLSEEETSSILALCVKHFEKTAGLKVLMVRGGKGQDGDLELWQDGSWLRLNLAQGLKLYTNAKLLVGMHGALFHHQIACPPDAHLLELIPANPPMLVHHVSAALGLTYWYFPIQGHPEESVLTLGADTMKQLEMLIVKVASAITHEQAEMAGKGEL